MILSRNINGAPMSMTKAPYIAQSSYGNQQPYKGNQAAQNRAYGEHCLCDPWGNQVLEA
ncbi:hypothetical protein HKBW3S09_00648 [Candidatus Hakubella thermalkaliphila]|uniref:Uncharacterized protein n=1 Tax=Candidatus Hakubella thermalkaliphila TaxID=2754717 RepID=A0A6V8NV74_9ACTN|nr:hypothetical protein HKBW3S09_00648 [Candidatus Hakubella thermalkaliphila]GFP43458.1 hypothetical protein HKBW3C_02588 [Candidatus Hakubella thermalkaliphila]